MDFVNLYLETEYTMLGSTIKLEALIEKCKADNLKSIAICDNNMHGAFKFYNLCIKNNIKPIIGLNLSLDSELGFYNNILLYAKGITGYKNLLVLATEAKMKKLVSFGVLRKYAKDLIAVLPSGESEVVRIYNDGNKAEAINVLKKYKFFEDLYLGIDFKSDLRSDTINELIELAEKAGVEPVAIHKTSFFNEYEFSVYKVLRCVYLGITEYPYDEKETKQYFLDNEELEKIYRSNPKLIENTVKISDKCNLELKYDSHYFPSYPDALGKSYEYLMQLCKLGLNKRLSGLNVNSKEYVDRLFYELDVINKMGYCDYFLIVYDFVKYAKKNNVLVGPGRGSAPGSLVAYCLGITDIDPIKYDLLFERFLNPERITMPDIDVDFPDNRRDEVISYVAKKYGSDKVASITTFGTYGPRLAIRDVVRANKVSDVVLNEILRHVKSNDKSINDCLENDEGFRRLVEENAEVREIVEIVKVMEGLPRHTSTHAAGIIIASNSLINYTALQPGINDIMQTQYEASDLEAIGLVKMDFLGLSNLNTIDDVVRKIKKTDPDFDLNNIPLDDYHTYKMIASGDTDGIFQLESTGMRNVLVKLKTSSFMDIVNANALYRPGPMEMIPSFINRKFGLEEIDYIDESLKEILEPTYGTIVFQEQIMLIVRKFAGYSLGMADILRRAVSKKNAEVLLSERNRFLENSTKLGHSLEVANKVYDYIVKFANYGFNKSHSVAYAMIAYQMAYLKRHYYRHFMSTLMSNNIGSVNLMKNYINDCKRKKVIINLPSVNYSRDDFVVYNNEIYYSLLGVAQLGALTLNNFLAERDQNGPYKSYQEFISRTKEILNKRIVENLIHAGALDEFGKPRKQMVLEYDNCLNIAKYNELLGDSLLDKEFSNEEYSFEEISKLEKEALGFNFKYSMFMRYRNTMKKYNAVEFDDLKIGKNQSTLFAIRNIREIQTKKGDAMAFLSVCDDSGELDVVCFPADYNRYKSVLREGYVYIATGDVEIRNERKQFVLKSINLLK
jgi:DNA polymerase-3 subunit alpha